MNGFKNWVVFSIFIQMIGIGVNGILVIDMVSCYNGIPNTKLSLCSQYLAQNDRPRSRGHVGQTSAVVWLHYIRTTTLLITFVTSARV